VRQVEALAKERTKGPGRASKKRTGKQADTVALEKRLSDALGLDVTIEHRGKAGVVSVRYRTLEQLDEAASLIRSPRRQAIGSSWAGRGEGIGGLEVDHQLELRRLQTGRSALALRPPRSAGPTQVCRTRGTLRRRTELKIRLDRSTAEPCHDSSVSDPARGRRAGCAHRHFPRCRPDECLPSLVRHLYWWGSRRRNELRLHLLRTVQLDCTGAGILRAERRMPTAKPRQARQAKTLTKKATHCGAN
jgi:hypothetical protein